MLLERVSPLIRDLHGKLLKGTELPFKLGPEVVYKPRERSGVEKDAISLKMKEMRELILESGKLSGHHLRRRNCLLASTTSSMLFMPFHMHLSLPPSLPGYPRNSISRDVPPELSYILIDTMRTVYGEDFYKDDKAMHQVAFAPKLDWGYRAA